MLATHVELFDAEIRMKIVIYNNIEIKTFIHNDFKQLNTSFLVTKSMFLDWIY